MNTSTDQPSGGHPFMRPGRLNSYTGYSVGFFAVWAVLWVICAITQSKHTIGYFGVGFGGVLIGWTSATIARLVYPAPKKRDSAGPTSFFQGFRKD